MLMNDGFYVCYGAVTYFYRVSVKYGVQWLLGNSCQLD